MAHDDQTDAQRDVDALVVRSRDDRESFGQLYDLFYERILRYCVRRLFRRCAAEEACSDVFLHVASHLQEFRGTTEREFCCWLYGIATNTINAQVRKKRRRDELLQDAVNRRALPGIDGVTATPDDERLDWTGLHDIIAQLSLRDQAIVTLRFFESLSHDEIGASLGMRSGAVRVALSRALEQIRRRLSAGAAAANDLRVE